MCFYEGGDFRILRGKFGITAVCLPSGVSYRDFFSVMCSGSSLQLLCILPFGMLCLSACRSMFVNILFAVCMFVGDAVQAKAASVSVTN